MHLLFDPGWGRTFSIIRYFYKHIIPSGLKNILNLHPRPRKGELFIKKHTYNNIRCRSHQRFIENKICTFYSTPDGVVPFLSSAISINIQSLRDLKTFWICIHATMGKENYLLNNLWFLLGSIFKYTQPNTMEKGKYH